MICFVPSQPATTIYGVRNSYLQRMRTLISQKQQSLMHKWKHTHLASLEYSKWPQFGPLYYERFDHVIADIDGAYLALI